MKKKLTTEDFIIKAKQIHGDKYDYSKTQYINAHTKVCIICPEHGEFWQTPSNHCTKSNKCGCPKCFGKIFDINDFVVKAQKIHGQKYNYTNVIYTNNHTKVCIICPEHGEFWQTPNKHLSGRGCPRCHEDGKKYYRLHNVSTFIEKAIKVHGNKYDYSMVEYMGNQKKICIICPEHGEFWQTPANHLRYKGCRLCRTSHLQIKVRNYLKNNNFLFNEEQTFNFLRNGKGNLSVDFYLPQYKIAIECQGIQHFKPVNFGGKLSQEEMDKNYELQVERDNRKKQLCNQNGIQILYINFDDKNIEETLNNFFNN